jgi:hypothetical protein
LSALSGLLAGGGRSLAASPRSAEISMSTFQALLLSLPTRNSTVRMRMWRTLKSTGCGVLRDGVYVLPSGTPQAAALAEVEAEVKAAGGSAMTVELNMQPSQLAQVHALFDRSSEYGALVAKIDAAKAALPRLGKRKADTVVLRLRRALDEVTAIDFYPGQAQAQAANALSRLERSAQDSFASSEPRRSANKLRKLDPATYRGRTWASRKSPWVDRLASAWLIKRFIDKDARFVWIERPEQCPKRAVGFDFDGAPFTHAAHRVTFEVLLASFGLDQDPALSALAAVVHFLDVGGIPAPDAKGLETVLSGVREKARNDDERVREASRIFDLVYGAYAHAAGSTR